MNDEEVKAKAEEDLIDAVNVESVVGCLMDQAKALVDLAIEHVTEAVKDCDGRPGCLMGKPEHYVQSIDAMIAKKDDAFDKNRAHIQRKIENGNPYMNEVMKKLENQFQ